MSADSKLNQQPIVSPEQALVSPANELINLLKDETFQKNFVKVQTEFEQQNRTSVISGMRQKAKQMVNDEVYKIAANRLGIVVEEGPALGTQWQQMIKEVKSEKVGDRTRWEQLNDNLLRIAEADIDFKNQLLEADTKIQQAETKKRAELSILLHDVESRVNDPVLNDALGVWGRSPNANGDFGIDNNGYNAGVIHFFEYRSVSEKNGRYKNSTVPITIDGFVFYSNCYKSLLHNIDPNENPDVLASALMTDISGQIRLQLITSNHEGIVTFRRANETGVPKIITIIPGQNEKAMEISVQSELSRGSKEKKRLNKLGDGVKRLPVGEYKNLSS